MTDSRIERLCHDKGLKMTEQRRVIARVLSDSEDHPDVEQVYRRATEIDPHISIATVYRTVRLFEEANILTKHDFGDGRSRYEEAPDTHHDHLIDVETGNVIEFVDDELEELQKRIAQRLGFRLVDHRMELYGVALDRKLDLELQLSDDLGSVIVDPAKLRQILYNYVSNALKFTEKGEVSVEVRAERGARVAFAVRDTGIGIDPTQQAAIFEPFVQVRGTSSQATEGTGLGLAISRNLARGMGGELSAASEVGRGSTFFLRLPRAERPLL